MLAYQLQVCVLGAESEAQPQHTQPELRRRRQPKLVWLPGRERGGAVGKRHTRHTRAASLTQTDR